MQIQRVNGEKAQFPCESPEPQKAEEAIWEKVREATKVDVQTEPLLSGFLYASILAHDSFEASLAYILSNRLANATMLPTQLFETFLSILKTDINVRCGALADLEAIRERDPACETLSHALLYFKGYHAVQCYRIANALWHRKQKVLALALQSRMSEVYAVDIHPAATIGKGLLLDHGTGCVIGETAVIGDNCSLLQGVTLGGTGKEIGDRHPKVADNVLIGASATILGNIVIGEGSQIAAGSLVLKPVPPHTMVAGSPAKPVGRVLDNPAESMLHWREKLQITASMEEEANFPVALTRNDVWEGGKSKIQVNSSVKSVSVEEAVARSKSQPASSVSVSVRPPPVLWSTPEIEDTEIEEDASYYI